MPPAGFEIKIQASDRRQSDALGCKLIIRLHKYLRLQLQPLDLELGQKMGGLYRIVAEENGVGICCLLGCALVALFWKN